NSANALSFATLDAAATDNGEATTVITTGDPIIFDETGVLTITVANGAETTVDIGALTRTAGNPTVKVVTLAADEDNQAINIDSITFAVAGEGDIEFTAENNAADDGDLTVTVGDLSTLGKVELDANDAGGDASALTVNLTGTTAVTEASTAVAAAKNSINLNISGASTTFTGGYSMDDVTLGVTLTMSGSAAQTFTGAVTVADDGDSKIDITNTAGTTFASLVGAAGANRIGEVDINASAIATFEKLVATDLLSIVGSVTLAENNNDALDFDIGAAGKLIVGKTVVATETLITDLGADATIHATAKLYAPINLKTGTAIILTDGGDGNGDDATMIAALNTGAVDSIIMDYTVTIDAANDQSDLNATVKTIATTASEAGITTNNATAMHQAFLAAINDTVADDGAEEAFEDALLNSAGTYSATEDTALALQVAPQTDTISGSAVATRAMTGTVQGIVSNRMASLRSGDAFVTGMSAGNGMSASSAFIQAFGSEAEQKNDIIAGATIYGYDSQTSGVAIGFDGMTETGETIGLSASFSTTDVDGKGTGKSKNAIDSYTVSVYADKATDNGYIEGSLTYGINDNTSSRIVNTAGLSRTYTGNYDSQQISLKVGGGAPNEVSDGTFVTPFLTATGTLITTDTYTETSTTASDALRLSIAQDDISSIVGTVGVKAHKVTDNGTPMISLSINNEFGDTTMNSSNTYTGGGTAFKTSTDVEALSATLGLGYSFGNDMTSLNINYEANANEEDYLSHYGTVKIVSKF
ncbi:autotransporter domain-containing protein, partial [Pelagibacteraceae bacterium]|nr:autotransporter domain-containing protein [Pelagibacteraceae bacterium]